MLGWSAASTRGVVLATLSVLTWILIVVAWGACIAWWCEVMSKGRK
jgi:hypothetical protein